MSVPIFGTWSGRVPTRAESRDRNAVHGRYELSKSRSRSLERTAMRNTVLTLSALAAVFQLACGSTPSSTDGTSGADTTVGTTPPGKNLTSAPNPKNSDKAPPARTGASTPIGSANTDTPIDPGASSSGGGSSSGGSSSGGSSSGGSSSGGSSSGGTTSGGPVDPNAGAGPKPTATCPVTKDSSGFFTRGSGASSYVAYVPASYDGSTPTRLIVGVHGCGDSAYNFATWGVNPYDTRSSQTHIGISIGGQDGNCWTAADDAKVLAAVADISSCFWVHQKKIVLAGYSSGGELTYRLGLSQASHFAGLLIEDSGLYAANNNPDGLLANAAWKLNIAHLTHTSDTTFPLAQVKADWTKTTAAGFPLITDETAGTHDGTSTDWANWLIPQSAAWSAP